MIDCLIVGFNDPPFAEQLEMLRGMGESSEAYRDVALAFVEHRGEPRRALDLLSALRPDQPEFHNADFLWPVVMVLGSHLARAGLSFDYVNLFHREKEALRAKLERGDVRTVAVTTTLYVSPQPVLEIVAFVRRHAPRTRIIVGGPYIHAQGDAAAAGADELLRYLGADIYVISQEGEATLARVLHALRAAGEGGEAEALGGIPNLAYRQGDHIRRTPLELESNALEDNPILLERFGEDLGTRISMRTAKSCPFSCAFCGFPERAGRYTYLPVEAVLAELDRLVERGVRAITFLDDTFNVPPRRFKALLAAMVERRYPLRWNSFYRADHGDEETIELMGASGCEGVFLGMEAGSDTMLEKMNKSSRTIHYRTAIPRLRAAGIVTHANFIVGFPGETMETFAETSRFIEEVRPDYFRAQLWYADPMTPVWKQREALGIVGSGFKWRHHTMSSEVAAALVDRMFLEIEGSVWLPQNGFEMWSLFYLEQRGFSRAEVRAWVRTFDEAVRARLLGEGAGAIPPALEERLSALAAGRPAPPLPEPRFAEAVRYAREVLGPGAGSGLRPRAQHGARPIAARPPLELATEWIRALVQYRGRPELRLWVEVGARAALLCATGELTLEALEAALERSPPAALLAYAVSADAARAGLGTAPLDAVIRVDAPTERRLEAEVVIELSFDGEYVRAALATAPGIDPETLSLLAERGSPSAVRADAALAFAF